MSQGLSDASNRGPLEGLRVLDLSSVVLGPMAAQYLGDMGADVVKIEEPAGDVTRMIGARRSEKMGALFLAINRNKRSIVLDLKRPDAQEALGRLVETADVLLHSIRTPAARRLGLDYEALAAKNPRLVFCHLLGFSDRGAYAGRAAYDDIVQALSGMAMLQKVAAGEPRYMPSILADKTTAVHAAYAIVLALFARERTGLGQRVGVPMLETMAAFLTQEHLGGCVFEPPIGPMGYKPVREALRRPFKTRDGHLCFLPYTDAHWRRFVELAGVPEIAADERFMTQAGRQANQDLVWGEVGRLIARRTDAEWVALMSGTDIPFAVLNDLEDLLDDPHLTSVGFWRLFDHPTEGRIRLPGNPLDMSLTPPSIRRLPPGLGEHTAEILAECGYGPAEIEARAAGRGGACPQNTRHDGIGRRRRMTARREEAAIDAVVVGAGFAGLYMLHKLREMGLPARAFEAGSGVGGTWFWNRYPGARCDVDSLEYSFSFSEELQQDWTWSERFAQQPEILSYLDHVADRFGLRPHIQLETRVTAAIFDEADETWLVETDRGDRVRCRYCIMASGCLSDTRLPAIPGIESFGGPVHHTGRWPHERVDFAGKRVAMIGTGSSGIQAAPKIAETAAHLTVFQRTPNFSIPARNAPHDPAEMRAYKAEYADKRQAARETKAGILYDYNDIKALSVSAEQRQRDFEARWRKGGVNFLRTYADIVLDEAANRTASDFVRDKIRATVRDPATAEMLLPYDHPIGTKRICVDSDYFETYNRPNVSLVDIRKTPIVEITADAIRTSERAFPIDMLVLATGYDAVTGALARIDIRGRGDERLVEKWAAGPRSYLGLMSAGFPNLFTITGPGSPSILTNVVVSIEQHVEWIAECIAAMRERGIALIEAEAEAEDAWALHVHEVAHATLMVKANSWYMGANIPGKPRLFMPYAGGFSTYAEKCRDIVRDNYRGFVMTPAAERTSAAA